MRKRELALEAEESRDPKLMKVILQSVFVGMQSLIFFPQKTNSVSSCSNKVTVPMPIKGAASIQKSLFQPCTMVHLGKILSIFTIPNWTKSNKTHLFLVFFNVRLLFKSVFYWCGYGILFIAFFWNNFSGIFLPNISSLRQWEVKFSPVNFLLSK